MSRTRRTNPRTVRVHPLRRAFGRASGPVAHLAWAVAVAGQLAGAALLDESDDFGTGMIVWVVTGLLFGAVTTAVVAADTRPRPGRPWDSPVVFGYLAAWLAGLLVSPAGFGYGALMLLITGLGGVCLLLAVALQVICWQGLRGFGAIMLHGDPADEGSRWSALGPFLATAGISLWFLPILGCVAFDSPYRRDLLPLVGVLRDGVEVTHPTLLLVAQLGTAWVLGLIAIGAVMTALRAPSRSRPRRSRSAG